MKIEFQSSTVERRRRVAGLRRDGLSRRPGGCGRADGGCAGATGIGPDAYRIVYRKSTQVHTHTHPPRDGQKKRIDGRMNDSIITAATAVAAFENIKLSDDIICFISEIS